MIKSEINFSITNEPRILIKPIDMSQLNRKESKTITIVPIEKSELYVNNDNNINNNQKSVNGNVNNINNNNNTNRKNTRNTNVRLMILR